MNVPGPDWRVHFAPRNSVAGNESAERTWHCRYCLAAVDAGHRELSLTIIPDNEPLALCHLTHCSYYEQAKTAGAVYTADLDNSSTSTMGTIPMHHSLWHGQLSAVNDLPPGWAESLAISRRLSNHESVDPRPFSEQRIVRDQPEYQQQQQHNKQQQQRMVTPVTHRQVRRRSSSSTGKSISKLLETQEKYDVQQAPHHNTRGSQPPLETATAAPVSRREFNAVVVELRAMIHQRDQVVTHLKERAAAVQQEGAAATRTLQRQVDSLESAFHYHVRGLDLRYHSLWTAHCELRDRLQPCDRHYDPGHGMPSPPL